MKIQKTPLYSYLILKYCVSILFLILLFNFSGYSQTSKYSEIISENESEIVLKMNFPDIEFSTVSTHRGNATYISMDDAVRLYEKGNPDLPKFTVPIIIPDAAKMKLEIIKSNFYTVKIHLVAPSKGTILRNENPNDIPYSFSDIYNENKYYPQKISILDNPYIFRDIRGQVIQFRPVQYNPVKKELKIYTQITVKISSTGNNGINALKRLKSQQYKFVEFEEIYQRNFINYRNRSLKFSPIGENGKMLIIYHPNYWAAIQPFIEWKTQKGIRVETVDVTTLANVDSIKSLVARTYHTKGLNYLLLVGDYNHVGQIYLNGYSDQAYGMIDGNDYYPEIIVGRFSGDTPTDIETQVKRSIDYEKTPNNTNYYSKGVTIASSEGPGDDNEWDWQHMSKIRAKLLSFNYLSVDEFYDGSPVATNDKAGNPNYILLGDSINKGRGIICYVGHGEVGRFVTTNFTSSAVNNLKNEGKLPFIFDVACQNGNLRGSTCIAESFVRAQRSGQPIGALAICASTNDQPWDPPMSAQDAMVDIMTQKYTNITRRTFGSIFVNGCMVMNDKYGSTGYTTTATWTIFGDPSIMVRTAQPKAMSISHNNILLQNTTQFKVYSDSEYATVCLWKNNNIIATSQVVGGEATLNFSPLSSTGVAKLTVTAFNKTTIQKDLAIVPQTGSYLIISNIQTNDTTYGNIDGKPDYNDTLSLNVKVVNMGVTASQNISVTLSSTSSLVTIVNNTGFIGNLNSGDSILAKNLFKFYVFSGIKDQSILNFKLVFKDNLDSIWEYDISQKFNAPELSLKFDTISEIYGNGNNRIDPGETIRLFASVKNIGHSDVTGVFCTLTSTTPYASIFSSKYIFTTPIQCNPFSFNVLLPSIMTFDLYVDTICEPGKDVDFWISLYAKSIDDSLYLYQKRTVGLKVEDFEVGSFQNLNWKFSGDVPWTIYTYNVGEGKYAAKSGTISDNKRTTMFCTFNITEDDTISFYRKVSSESTYDKLQFIIDGVVIKSWSGAIPWANEKFPVKKGLHTFNWTYFKDVQYKVGDDCAMIDYIVFQNMSQFRKNYEPYFSSIPLTFVMTDSNYVYQITYNDSDLTDKPIVKCLSIPSWLTFVNNGNGTAKIYGKPTDNNVGVHYIELEITDGKSSKKQYFSIQVGLNIENWESANTSRYFWELPSTKKWIIDSNSASEGSYSLTNETIRQGNEAILQLKAYIMKNDTISFMRKVVSLKDYDFLKFYIDDTLKGEWSGNLNWEKVRFGVKEGQRTFKWIVKKSSNDYTFEQKAWIDFITLPRFGYRPVILNDSMSMPTAYEGEMFEENIFIIDRDFNTLTTSLLIKPFWLNMKRINNEQIYVWGIPENVGKDTLQSFTVLTTDFMTPEVYKTFAIKVKRNNSSVSLNELKSIGIYPNPTDKYLYIKNIENYSPHCSFQIFDVYGKLIKSVNINSYKIDVSDLKSGVYILNIKNNEIQINRKFIKN